MVLRKLTSESLLPAICGLFRARLKRVFTSPSNFSTSFFSSQTAFFLLLFDSFQVFSRTTRHFIRLFSLSSLPVIRIRPKINGISTAKNYTVVFSLSYFKQTINSMQLVDQLHEPLHNMKL